MPIEKLEKTKLWFNGNQNINVPLDNEDIIDKLNEVIEKTNKQEERINGMIEILKESIKAIEQINLN